jgi:hypothetical protein
MCSQSSSNNESNGGGKKENVEKRNRDGSMKKDGETNNYKRKS